MFELKTGKKSMHFVKLSIILRNEDLCKLGKEYLNALRCNFYTYFIVYII